MFSGFALILAASGSLQSSPGALRFRPAGTGDLVAWLVAGPFPNGGSTSQTFEKDLIGEATAAPVEGEGNWRFAVGNVAHGLDLKALLRTDAPGIAYCYTQLESPSAQDSELKFGSDDGIKIFLNGKQVFSHEVKRGVIRDEEHIILHLQAGLNRLLCKVEQYDGGWGLMARLPSPNGVVQCLSLKKEIADSWAPIRQFVGTDGAIDLEIWHNYLTTHAKVQNFYRGMRDRVHAPEMLKQILDDSDRTVKEDCPSCEAFNLSTERLTKKLNIVYTATRKPLLDWAQNPGPFVTTKPLTEDYVRVMEGGRYFAHSDGKPFIPISLNHNPDWPDLIESYPLHDHYDPKVTDRWFAKLKSNGVNLVRLMVETPPSGNLEEKIGVFRPEHLIWLDHIFQSARQNGIKLWITPYDTFWMSLRADASPYWKANGGLIDKPIDFLTKPAIIEAQKRRMRYLIDRYGNSGVVLAWEIMNEIDLWWNASPQQIQSWEQDMAAYVREYEHKKWGRNHLIAMSMANAEPQGLNAETEFRSKNLDFATMHLYLGVSKAPHSGEADQAGIDYAKGVTYALSQIKDNRPAMDGESGPIDHWIDDPAFDNEVFHQMSWRHLMAGGAGSGTRWPYRHPHELSDGMLATLRSMRTFTDGVNWKAMTGTMVITDSGFKTPHGEIGLVTGQTEITLSNAKGGVFDVRKGIWIWQGTTASPFKIPVPAGSEVAFWSSKG